MLFGVCIVSILPIGVTENIEGGRVSRRQLGCFLVVLDRFRHVLLSEVVTAQIEMRALIVWISGDELVQKFLLLGGVAIGAGFGGQDQKPLAV